MAIENKDAATPRGRVQADRRTRRLSRAAVVVFDSDRDDLEHLSILFEREGAEVRRATCAADALALLRERLPDVVVSGLSLPVAEGLAFISEVRRDPALQRVAAIAVTGSFTSRVAAEDAGFDRFLVKPVDEEELIGEMARMLGVRRRAVGS